MDLDVTVYDAIPFPEYCEGFPNFLNSDSRTSKLEITYYNIFSPSRDNRANIFAKAEITSMQSFMVTLTLKHNN